MSFAVLENLSCSILKTAVLKKFFGQTMYLFSNLQRKMIAKWVSQLLLRNYFDGTTTCFGGSIFTEAFSVQVVSMEGKQRCQSYKNEKGMFF